MIEPIFENPEAFAVEYRRVLESLVGKDFHACTALEQYQALAQLIALKANGQFATSDSENKKSDKKKVYYFCLEFLLGPLLDNYLLNYGVRDTVKEGLAEMGIDLEELISQEVDPGLGNGGLGRLAACFLDSMAAEGILGFGNGMRYHYGLFKQQIVDGRQVEVTDNWLDKGYPWETKHPESAVLVRFGGEVVRHEEDGKYWFTQEGGELIRAVPYDVPVIGYGGKTVNRLRLWSAEPAHEDFDLDAFNAGDYAKAAKFRTDAEAITEILYPNDAGEHGRILRLKQEYLFVAAGLASIIRNYKYDHGEEGWERFPDFVGIHTTTPTPPCAAPSLCACSWTRRAWTGTPPGTSPCVPSPTPTTRCFPRPSRSGPSRPSVACSRACTCTSTRSTAATWTPSRVTSRAGRRSCATPPSCGTARCVWPTSL